MLKLIYIKKLKEVFSMFSIPHKYCEVLQNIINNYIKDKFSSLIPIINVDMGVFNYINFSSNVDETINDIARKLLISYFEMLDLSFKHKPGRTNRYHVKNTYTRSILTIFGEITYSKTIYLSTLNNSTYCPIDSMMGLKAHDYYDPFIKSLVVQYAANNSYSKTAKYINNIISNRFKLNNNSKYLMTRQTVHNIIKQANLDILETTNEIDIDTLYVMADEHFVASQDKEKDYMVKQVVVFEDIKTIKKRGKGKRRKSDKPLLPRRKLIGKHVISVVDSSIHNETLDYIFNNYNIDNIKNIILMGDGASWIQTLKDELKFDEKVNVTFGLDKYHFKQALKRIFLDKEIEESAEDYIISNDIKAFTELTNEAIKNAPHREKTINKSKEYIINHIKSIIYLYDKKLSCPMESQISHNVASRFTSRPCGFSKTNINQLLKLKTMSVNNQQLALSYLNGLNPNKQQFISINNNINSSRYNLKPTDQEILDSFGRNQNVINFI